MEHFEASASWKRAIEGVSGPSPTDSDDYRIATAIGTTFLARGRKGTPTLLIPLENVPAVPGRRGGGFALGPAERVAFQFNGRVWEQAAATFECTEPHLIDTFLVLVQDLTRRLASNLGLLTWQTLVEWVEEWQTLLARRRLLTLEQQIGLWAELWVIAQASDPDALLQGWRGPEQEATDFFLDGIGLEVKASRHAHVHYVSQRQVDGPVGVNQAFVLSIWAGIDPARGTSLSELIDFVVARVADPPVLLRRITTLGYAPLDRESYIARFVPLEPPRWFSVQDIPRVRVVDPGVSQLRYLVRLDVGHALTEEASTELWRHFCGQSTHRIIRSDELS
ncbi:MAG: PD-(D/E)XK motif protein [Vicinamibacterales bacterium]